MNEENYIEDVFENEEATELDYDMTEESRIMDSLDYSSGMQELVSYYY